MLDRGQVGCGHAAEADPLSPAAGLCVRCIVRADRISRLISAVGSISQDGTATRLIYLYENKVNPGLADDDMNNHEGAADLRIKTDGTLEGSYFNSRKRAGTIQATRRAGREGGVMEKPPERERETNSR